MENNDDLLKALANIKKVANNDSWFRGGPHRWPIASFSMAYGMACVEVVAKSSEKAGEIYKQLVEAWTYPGLKNIYEAIIAEVSDSELEKVKDALIHPEKAFSPDANKPFRDLEAMFAGLEINDDFLSDDGDVELSPEEEKDLEQLEKLICLILEFIIVGFNRESDIAKGRYRVLPSEKPPWLIMAVMMRTSFESHNLTIERLRHIYLIKKYKGKIINFHEVLTEQPMSRWHRRMVAGGKAAKLKLKNDRVFLEAARHWYNSRVVYPSINKYCDAPGNYHLDPKNISKQIRPCDDAVGYIRRLHRKA